MTTSPTINIDRRTVRSKSGFLPPTAELVISAPARRAIASAGALLRTGDDRIVRFASDKFVAEVVGHSQGAFADTIPLSIKLGDAKKLPHFGGWGGLSLD